jgi:hypothetical protein
MSFLENVKAITTADDLKEVMLPSGQYVFQCIKVDPDVQLKKELTWSGKTYPEGENIILITLKPKEPVSVDDEELDECPDWQDQIQTIRVFSDTFKRDFVPLVEHMGINPEEFLPLDASEAGQQNFTAMCKAMLKKEVLVDIERKWYQPKDGSAERQVVNIKKIGTVE